MNKKHWKEIGTRIGAFLLICSIVIGSLPSQVFATEHTASALEITEQVATPTYAEELNPGNLFTGSTNFTLHCVTSGAKVYYTLDGTTPTTKSNQFYYEEAGASVSIDKTTTIKAYAVKDGMEDSEVLTFVLTKADRVQEPKITPSVESFEGSVEITMASDTEGATIYYTTNGKEPNKETGTLYAGPITLNETTSIQAIAYKDGMNTSFITYKVYTAQNSITLKANAEYIVSAHIVEEGHSGGYSWHEFSGYYGDTNINYKMKITTDAEGNATIIIPCVYKWLYDDYFVDLQFYTDETRTTLAENTAYKAVEGSGTSSDELKGNATFSLPNLDVIGIYYGTAKTLEYHDGFVKNNSFYEGNVELRIEWDTLKEVVDQVEAPTFSAPDNTVFEKTENEVILRSETPGATIYYTEDTYFATHPSEASASQVKVYTGPIIVTEKVNIAAIAVKDGMDDSQLTRVSYDVKAKPELENNATYTVNISIENASNDWLGYDGRYSEEATIVVDNKGQAIMSIQCIYKGGYSQSYIKGFQLYEAENRKQLVPYNVYEVKEDSIADGVLRGVASFNLPYIDGMGIYYGTADHSELDWKDVEVVTANSPINLKVDWTSLVKTGSGEVDPPTGNPDEPADPDNVEAKKYKVYATLIDSVEDPDSIAVPFMLGANGFLGLYGPELSMNQGTDGKKTIDMSILSGLDWNTWQTIYFESMEIYTDVEKTTRVSDLTIAAYNGNGTVTFTLGAEAELEGRQTFYITATLNDGTVKNGMLIIDWEQLTEVLPFTSTPVFTPNGGTLQVGETITLTCADPDATIYYAFGQYMNPFWDNQLQDYAIEYTGPFTIEENVTIVAQAYEEGKMPSTSVEVNFKVEGGAKTLGDMGKVTYDTSHAAYDKVELTTTDNAYKTIMNTGNGMPTVSEYYILVSQGDKEVRHLYNGGIGGFTVAAAKNGGSNISILLEKDVWNPDEVITFTVVAKDYSSKVLRMNLAGQKINKQTNVEASKGNAIINRDEIQVGETYTASFTAIKTGTNDESMLAGFFEPIAKIEVGEEITYITFRNMVMPDQLQDFGLKGSGDWKGAVLDGERVENATEAFFTIPVSTADFREGFFTGGVNVLAMGGSLANNGVYTTYTSVEITFAEEITEGFVGFEGNLNGLTEEIIRNRNLLVGAPGIDTDGDGHVSDDEIRAYAPASKTLSLSTGSLTGLGYSTFDNIQMEDIEWIKLLNPDNFIKIDLSGHNISEITDEFKGFTHLEVLNLRANNIRFIEDNAFSDLGELTELGLSSNLLSVITDKTFAGLENVGNTAISEFGLGQNAITDIAPNAFQDMKYVKGLFLYENQLESLPEGVLNGMDSLETIYIETNHLKAVPADIATSTTLKEVKLYNNEISDVSNVFSATIQKIDLGSNYIQEVPADLLNENRTKIVLSDNAITTMPKTYAEKALGDTWNFGTVFQGNPIDVNSIEGLSASQISSVKSALTGVSSALVGLELVAKDGEITYTSTLTAFDYFFWNLSTLDKNKGAVRQAIGKDVIQTIEEYEKFKSINLKSFSKEDISKSILSDEFGTIVDYTITTRLQILRDGEWITLTNVNTTAEDVKNETFEIPTMKAGEEYRVVKTVGKYKIIAQATAEVKVEENEDNVKPNPDADQDSEQESAFLKDGTYSIEIQILHANDDGSLSMANQAVKKEAVIGVVDGKATMSMEFQPMILAGTNINGHLLKLWIYDDENPMIAKTYNSKLRKEAGYSEFYNQEDGQDPIPSTNGEYPGKVTFEMPYLSDAKGYDRLYVRVSVDAMAGYDQNAIVELDYTTLKKIDEEPPVVPPTKPDTSTPDTSKPDTSTPDTSKPDTSTPDTSKPDTDSSQNNTTLDVKNLKDGVYAVTGTMLKTDRTSLSMANSAFNKAVKLTVKNGKYEIALDFKGMDINGMQGYLGNLGYYANGYTVGSNGIPQGSVNAVTVASIQKDTEGVPVSDAYGTNYPDVVTFPLIASALNDGYVPLQVFVPIMDAISSGAGTQSVYLYLDWTTLKSTTANNSVFNDTSSNESTDSEEVKVPSVQADTKVDEEGNVEVSFENQVVIDTIQRIVEQGIVNAEGKREIVLEGTVEEGRNAVKVKISHAIMSAIAENLDQVVVKLGVVNVTIPAAILGNIVKITEEDVELDVKRLFVSDIDNLSDDMKQQIGDRPIFDFSLIVNGEMMHEFTEEILISIPYTLQEGENPKNLAVYYINDDGEVTTMDKVRYNEETEMLEFMTTHFSVFAVGYREYVTEDEETSLANGQGWLEDDVSNIGVNKVAVALITILSMVLAFAIFITIKNKKRV